MMQNNSLLISEHYACLAHVLTTQNRLIKLRTTYKDTHYLLHALLYFCNIFDLFYVAEDVGEASVWA
jgi:hypothetical protein